MRVDIPAETIKTTSNILKFILPYDAESKLQDYLTKIEKKFAKINLGTTYEKEPVTYRENGREVNGFRLIIKVEYPLIKHEGYSYFATLKKVPTDSGDEIQVFSSDSENLNQYHNVEFRCDHCHTNHTRYTVHLFKDDNGNEKIIGSSCAKEYFGIDIARQLNKLLNYYNGSFISEIEDEFKCFRGIQEIDKENLAKMVYGTIKEKGKYISRKRAEIEFKEPTSELVEYYMKDHQFKNASDRIEFNETSKRISILGRELDYEKVKEYWDSKDENDTFNHNIQISLKMLQPKTGMIAYAVWEYMNEVEDFTGKKKLQNIESNHIGKVGDKVKDISMTAVKITGIETQWGYSTRVQFLDENDNIFIWWASKEINFDENDKVQVSGTIKKHDEYKGQKQTIITRCKVKQINDQRPSN